jgi:peptidoglycan hydrolase CwlO-like protein
MTLSIETSIETSNLTLAYLNSENTHSQLATNLNDVKNNVSKFTTIVNNLFNKLDISQNKISEYQSLLMDISNNITN